MTRALDLLKRSTHLINVAGPNGSFTTYYAQTQAGRIELIRILTDMDARTGRRDPSKRKKRTVRTK